MAEGEELDVETLAAARPKMAQGERSRSFTQMRQCVLSVSSVTVTIGSNVVTVMTAMTVALVATVERGGEDRPKRERRDVGDMEPVPH
ncbi:hypothetical protein ACNKHQ_18365 [Shigella flexneri]